MRAAALILALGLSLPLSAQAAALLTPSEIDPSRYLPPPPVAGSVEEKAEFQELKAIAARSTPDEVATAARDAKDESPDIFNAAIGFDLTAKPETFKLMKLLMEEEEIDSKLAKTYFHRMRPYSVDASIKTCEPVKPGKAPSSYPSGHSSLAFSMGVVLASLIPEKSQAILARAEEYAQHRLVCGVHFRSDIVAGQQFGTVLALKLMQNPAFRAQMDLAKAELRVTQ